MAHPEVDIQSNCALLVDLTLAENKGGADETGPVKKQRRASTRSITDKPLLCKNVLFTDQECPSLDSNGELGAGTDSEPGFTSDSEAWSDEDEDTSDDSSVLCLTSNGARPLETTDSLRPPLPRRLSFKPLEKVEESTNTTKQLENTELARTPLESRPSPSFIIAEASPGEMFQNEYFTITKTESAGWGAFAARDLKYGDRILYEKPLFVADWWTLFEEYEKLDRPRKEIAMSLHANELCKTGTPKLQAVWNTNCFAVSGVGEAGLFPIAARFNHACNPNDNIGYTFNEEHRCLEMVVKTDKVSAGEELCISYGYQRTPKDLYLAYGFQCRCQACPGLTDDEVYELNSAW